MKANNKKTKPGRVGRALALATLLATLAPGCVHHARAGHNDGAVSGAILGAAAGGILTDSLGGAIVGGIIGAHIGRDLDEQAERDARAAARSRETVVYVSDDRRARVVSAPVGWNEVSQCSTVNRRVWQDGELVVNELVEVCDTYQ